MTTNQKSTWGSFLFALIWTAITTMMVGFFVRDIVQQLNASRFVLTGGRVIKSNVTETRSGKGGRSYGTDIQYSYTVNQKAYVAQRIRFATQPSGRSDSQKFVATHPAGSEITVYYNPEKPDEALLQPGLAGEDLFASLFLSPFAMFAILMWAEIVASKLRGRRLNSQIEFTEIAGRTRARLPCASPGWAAAMTVGFAPLAVMLPLFFWSPMTMTKIGVGWFAVIATAMVVFVRQKGKIARGHFDLWLDPAKQVLIVPSAATSRAPQAVPYDDVLAIEKLSETQQDRRRSLQYFTTVSFRSGGEERKIKLAKLNAEEDADQFTNWLKERVPMAPPRRLDAGTGVAS